ncbi:uncharacterized protein LOC119101550 [Pollicipes pollicipes]|uniref:uncharacterized protein LOC119101550 n=1 Tax=Pollicipes pollicipes TaxID=41117 RepID=UPI0018852190|nr:uncharacterized protein LOC119101550 [Pollicipes pollicipes]
MTHPTDVAFGPGWHMCSEFGQAVGRLAHSSAPPPTRGPRTEQASVAGGGARSDSAPSVGDCCRWLTQVTRWLTQVTDASCDASAEYSSGESGGELDSSESEVFDCSVVTCREVAPAAAGRESAPPQAALHSKRRSSNDQSVTPLNLTPPQATRDPAPAGDTPTPTSSSGGSTILTCSAQHREPTNSNAPGAAAWAGRHRPHTRRPITTPSSGSEGGAPGSPTRRRRRVPRSAPVAAEAGQWREGPDGAASGQAGHLTSQLSGATDTTLEDLSTGDVTEDTCDVISSVSEQAWDPYQEYKEISEPGSEAALDPAALLRFLDCDDYRNFLDSVSDCTSSQVSGTPAARRPPPRRLRRQLRTASDSGDSDTDSDELAAALAESRRRLLLAQSELGRRAAQHDPICVSEERRLPGQQRGLRVCLRRLIASESLGEWRCRNAIHRLIVAILLYASSVF